MMKIVFVENRYKTFFWERIAKELVEANEIHWVIQNKMFKPSMANLHVVPYPNDKKNVLKDQLPDYLSKIATSDRLANHFDNQNFSHYLYYYSKIEKLIDTLKPNIFFGEATQFFELIIIDICKKRNILYLNPSSSRYPANRFSFYLYDTLTPHKGSGKIFKKEQVIELTESIGKHQVKPDYIGLRKPGAFRKVKDKIRNILGFFGGEKFCTPSPIKKIIKNRKTSQLQKKWDKLSTDFSIVTGLRLLYPLQMQPESNIDVWGRLYRDQTELILSLSEEIKGATLFIKPNPKSKYELSHDLIDTISCHSNIKLLDHKVKMSDIIDNIDLVVTVTGTIAIERILGNKPVVTLVETINNSMSNCIYINRIEEVNRFINDVEKNRFPTASLSERIDFINLLTRTSYIGRISDPYVDMKCIAEENIQNIVYAFNDVLHDFEN